MPIEPFISRNFSGSWAAALVLGLLFAGQVRAHDSSVTRIDVRAKGDGLTVTIGLNQSDILEHILKVSHEKGRFPDRQAYEDAAPRVLRYVIDHLSLKADGRALGEPSAPGWPVEHVELSHLSPGGLEIANEIRMTLRYALPGGAEKIELQPLLFVRKGFLPIFIVTFHPADGSPPVEEDFDNSKKVEFQLTSAAAGAGTNGTPYPASPGALSPARTPAENDRHVKDIVIWSSIGVFGALVGAGLLHFLMARRRKSSAAANQ